jgi:hypothetical protein
VGGEAWQRERLKLEKGLRRMAKEEERLCRAEQRKDMVREVLMQGGRVKWRKGEGGWSSVAEPKLSPIMQSPMGSGKSFGSGAHDGSFLEMAAAARGVDGCRRRQLVNVRGATGMVLAQRQQVGQVSLSSVERGGMGRGLSTLGKLMVKLCLPPVVPRRESSQHWDTSRLLDPYPEWELGNLIVIPVDFRRLSEDCRVRRISTGRVVELDDLGPTEPWTRKQLHNLSRPANRTGRMLQESTAGEGRGLTQARPSVYTPTTTTTGFEHGHGQPRHRAGGHPFDAMLDGFKEAPLIRRAWTLRALSRSTLTRSSTRTSTDGFSDQLASPGSMQLSVWQSLNNLGLQIARTTAPAWKKVGIGPPQGTPIRLRPLKPGPDSATTSSSTDRETAAHAQEKEPWKPVPNTDGAADDRLRGKPDWAMRKTMRKPPDPNPSHLKGDEPATRRSSPTYTRTSTSPMTRPHSPKATPPSARRRDEGVTIARGAARTAFRQTTDSRRALPMMIISGSVTVRPISAPDPSRAPPHGAGATGTAKTAAKPASAAGTGPGQGQGQGKGKGKETKEKGPGQDGAKGQQEKKEGQDKGKGKEKEGQQNKDKGKKDAMAGSPEFRQWMRNAVMMLARVVGAYWQVVSPVFDGESELRKRLDKAQATRGDGVMCVLAVVFLFLVVSVGVWAVRGIMWLVRLLGEFGEVLRVVAGLQN